MRRSTLAVALVLLALAVGCKQAADVAAPPSAAAEGPPMPAAELAARIESGSPPVVLDVRTPLEYENGHIPGAINIPHDQLADRLDELGARKDTEIVVHCEAGRRAGKAEDVLTGAGYTHVRDLEGQFHGWRQKGLPVESQSGK